MDKATHATATIAFGKHAGEPHTIRVNEYRGLDDERGEDGPVITVSDAAWDAAYGSSDAEKIASILEWNGDVHTEFERLYVHATFNNGSH